MIKNPIKIIFIGTSDFGLPSLERIYNCSFCKLVGIITTYDKKASRGQKLSSCAVKKWALEKKLSIPIFEPKNLKDLLFLENLKELKADLQVVIAFRMLPKELWSMPPLGTINLHASLLPNYRGSAPIHHAVINGEKQTGLTTFFIDEQIDTGNLLLQTKMPIGENETTGELYQKLSILGASLVMQSIKSVENNNFKSISQPLKGDFKEAPKLTSEFMKIDWNDSIKNIYNKIRGLSPYPGAWTKICFDETNEKRAIRMKIFSVEKFFTLHRYSSRKIIFDFDHYEMKIILKEGYLSIKEAQIEGKTKLPIKDLINGFKNKPPTHVF